MGYCSHCGAPLVEAEWVCNLTCLLLIGSEAEEPEFIRAEEVLSAVRTA